MDDIFNIRNGFQNRMQLQEMIKEQKSYMPVSKLLHRYDKQRAKSQLNEELKVESRGVYWSNVRND